MVRFRVLGPVSLASGEGSHSIPAAKERTLLAVLLANANTVVSPDRLTDELWPDDPPRTATKTVQTYVSHLRRHIGDRLESAPGGYRLRVRPGDVDADVFEQTVADGRLQLLRADFGAAAEALAAAEAMWAGDAYEDTPRTPSITAAATRLDELRQGAREDRIESQLRIGDTRTLVAELEAMVVLRPERERVWGLLMLALDREGRRVDALRAFQRARTYFVEELGVEPGAELQAIEAQLIRGDAAFDEEPPAYVRNADGLKIAYRMFGSGRPVVFCPEIFFSLELMSDVHEVSTFLAPIAKGRHLIGVQRRGTGLSERDTDALLAPIEKCADDIDAVLDRLSIERADVVGWGHGGQVALAYAALRPHRVRAVAVVNSYALMQRADNYPVGAPIEQLDALSAFIAETWGTHRPLLPIFDPSIAFDPEVITRFTRIERLVATPREAADMRTALNQIDIRPLLPSVACPVLVAGLTGSVITPAMSKWLADHLPNATYIERPGAFVPSKADAGALGEEFRAFLDGLPG